MRRVPEPLAAALGDRYRIERELGSGGMATVYLAEDLKHRRQVAIKVLKSELAAALGADRFLREVSITARLTHPHILPLLDSGESGEFLYYVMPYVEGETIRDRLTREKQLPLDDALQITREVADALSYAHSHGVIHRDIKPENILLESGHAVVADFGIARAIDMAGGERLTETGLAIGTPAYMSPEQAAGETHLDGRADLYSLGCVLYEMLAGQPPFTGPTLEAVLRQHLTVEPRSVTSVRPAVPAPVAAALQRALAKTPADRFNPVGQFAEALALAGRDRVPAATAQWSRGVRTLLFGAAVIVVGGAVAALLLPGEPAVPTPGRTAQVTFDPVLELDAAMSPDGRAVAYAAGPLHDMRIYVRQVAGSRPLAPAPNSPAPQRRPVWSSDGTKLLFMSGERLYEVPALGGPARLLLRLEQGMVPHATWSPDGTEAAYVRSDTIYVRRVADGDERVINFVRDAHSLAWSPDGRWLACVSGNSHSVYLPAEFGNTASAGIWILPVANGQPVAVTEDTHLNLSPAWLPDGRLLFVSNRGGASDVYAQVLRRDGRPSGTPIRLTTGLNAFSVTASADGRTLAYSTLTRRQNIWSLRIPPVGSTSAAAAQAVTQGNQVIEGLAVSPDGEWIAFDSDRAGNQDVYRRPLAGGELVSVTDHPADEFVHSWSPDGEWLSGHGFRGGDRDAFVIRTDGTRFQLVATHPAHDRYPDWSPDGQRIVLLSDRAGGNNLFLIERLPEDRWSEPEQVTFDGGPDGGFGGPRWSPDGRWIAYVGPSSVRHVAADGGAPRVLFQGREPVWPIGVSWSHGGSSITYLGHDANGLFSFWTVPVSGGRPQLLVRFESPDQRVRPEFMVHGDRLYFTLGEFDADVWVMDLNLAK